MQFKKEHVVYWNHWFIIDHNKSSKRIFISKQEYSELIKRQILTIKFEYLDMDMMYTEMLENECLIITEENYNPSALLTLGRIGEVHYGTKLPKSKRKEYLS